MATITPRYVCLRHTLPEGDRPSHWDLMFQHGDCLRTWAVDQQPGSDACREAQELPGHRLAYLDYEGPVSGNRGSVVRWDVGVYQAVEVTLDRWLLDLEGERLRGRILFERVAPGSHSWRVSFVAAPNRG